MQNQLINEVKQLKKIAGILQESIESSKITDEQGITYDMQDGVQLPYDGRKMANKFRKIAKGLGMIEGPAKFDYEIDRETAKDYQFVYEEDESDQPDAILILNPEMQSNELIRDLVKKCLRQYGND